MADVGISFSKFSSIADFGYAARMTMENHNIRQGIILTRFPLESGWGGEEKLHLHLFDSLKISGTKTVVWTSDKNIARRFGDAKHKIHFSRWYRDITAKWSLLIFPIVFLLLYLTGMVRLRQWKRQGFTTIVMLTLIEKIVLTKAAHRLGLRVIWAHHAPLSDWFFRNPLFRRWQTLSKLVTIITPSHAMKNALQKARPQGALEVVPNPVMIEPSTAEIAVTFRQQNNLAADAIVVGTAGRIAREKNPFQFVYLAEQFPQISFVMAGEGEMKKHIEQIISSKKLRNILLVGQLTADELAAFYSACDIVCVLSDYETFCLVAAEALASGTPVIAPNVGGLPEVVTHGENGLLFSVEDYAAAANSLRKLIENEELRNTMSVAAMATQKRFSKEEYEAKMRVILFG